MSRLFPIDVSCQFFLAASYVRPQCPPRFDWSLAGNGRRLLPGRSLPLRFCPNCHARPWWLSKSQWLLCGGAAGKAKPWLATALCTVAATPNHCEPQGKQPAQTLGTGLILKSTTALRLHRPCRDARCNMKNYPCPTPSSFAFFPWSSPNHASVSCLVGCKVKSPPLPPQPPPLSCHRWGSGPSQLHQHHIHARHHPIHLSPL